MLNSILFGDCRDYFKQIDSESIDLVATDCPYKVVSGGCTNTKNATSGILSQDKLEVKKGVMFSENNIKFSEWLPEVFRVLKNGTHCYIFINSRNLKELQTEAERVGFKFQNLLVWNKGNVTPNRYYMQKCEFILMLRKGSARTVNDRGMSNIIDIPNIIGNKTHPTEKPVVLNEILVSQSSNPGDIVLDPFMGTGSLPLACINTGRKYIGIEIEENYYDIAACRIKEYLSYQSCTDVDLVNL